MSAAQDSDEDHDRSSRKKRICVRGYSSRFSEPISVVSGKRDKDNNKGLERDADNHPSPHFWRFDDGAPHIQRNIWHLQTLLNCFVFDLFIQVRCLTWLNIKYAVSDSIGNVHDLGQDCAVIHQWRVRL